MSIRIKKKSKLYKLVQETILVERIIFEYLDAVCLNFLLLDKIIYHTLIGRIKARIGEVEKQLSSRYANIFDILKQSQQIVRKKIGSKKQNLFLSFNLSTSRLEPELKYSIMYSYQYRRSDSQKSKQYCWTLEFFLTSKSQRKIWMVKQKHVEVSLTQIYAQLPTYLMDAIQVRPNDVICLQIPFYILGKPVKKIRFYPIISTEEYSFENSAEKICSWTLQKPLKRTIDFQVEQLTSGLQKYFKTLNVHYSSNEKYYKIELLCISTFQQVKIFDCFVRSVQPNAFLQIFLKKKGSFSENYSAVDLRLGDILVLYLIKS